MGNLIVVLVKVFVSICTCFQNIVKTYMTKVERNQ